MSDAKGQFRAPVAPGRYGVMASAPDLATRAVVQVSASAGLVSESVTLKLEPAWELTGHVTHDGAPVVGARVVANNIETGRPSMPGLSQEDGSFVLKGVDEGNLAFTADPWLVVSPTEYKRTSRRQAVELQVKPAGQLSGVVTREGHPVDGAAVEVRGGDRSMPLIAYADAGGHYAVRGLKAGSYRVVAHSERVHAFVEKRVTVGDQEDFKLDLELDSAARIAGKVVDARGVPVEGVTVVYRLGDLDEGRGVTGEAGDFVCDEMSGGGAYVPRVSAAYGSPAFQPAGPPLESVTLADGHAHVEGVELRVRYERLSISGHVQDSAGQLLPDARVQAAALEPGKPPQFNGWTPLPTGVTDAQGAFHIDALPAGDYAVRARSSEGDETVLPKVAAGVSGLSITVQRAGTIDGTLVGYTQAPIVYARPVDAPGPLRPGQVSDNTFQLRAPAGAYVVTAMTVSAGDAQRVEVRAGETSKVTLTNRAQATIEGTIVDHFSGEPVRATPSQASEESLASPTGAPKPPRRRTHAVPSPSIHRLWVR